jgi:bacterioferritin
MGKQARAVVGKTVDSVIKLLNKAYADEWLAQYQYWIGAQVVVGPMRDAAVKELMEHYKDENRHAQMLADRIIQLGGVPLLSPQAWYKETNAGFHEPKDPLISKVVEQNLKGEQDAILVYHHIMKHTKDTDPTTYHLAERILADELHHEQDLENMLEDLGLIKKFTK